jgi:hypothetical protein
LFGESLDREALDLEAVDAGALDGGLDDDPVSLSGIRLQDHLLPVLGLLRAMSSRRPCSR